MIGNSFLSPEERDSIKFAFDIYGLAVMYLILTFIFRMGTDINRSYEAILFVFLLIFIVSMFQRSAVHGYSGAKKVGFSSGFMAGLLYLFQDIFLSRVLHNVSFYGLLRVGVDISVFVLSIVVSICVLLLNNGGAKDRLRMGPLASLFTGLAIYSAMLLPLFFFLFRFEVLEYLSIAILLSFPSLVLIGLVQARYSEGRCCWQSAFSGFMSSILMIVPFLISLRAAIDPGAESGGIILLLLLLLLIPMTFILTSALSAAVGYAFFERLDRRRIYKEKYLQQIGDLKVLEKSQATYKEGRHEN